AAYLQVVRGYNAIQTGVIFTAATVGVLVASLGAERLAKRYAQRTLIMAGFAGTIVGIGGLIALAWASTDPWVYTPGLLLIGSGGTGRNAARGALLTVARRVVSRSVHGRRDRRPHTRRGLEQRRLRGRAEHVGGRRTRRDSRGRAATPLDSAAVVVTAVNA